MKARLMSFAEIDPIIHPAGIFQDAVAWIVVAYMLRYAIRGNSLSRLLPGVLGNPASAREESFQEGLLDGGVQGRGDRLDANIESAELQVHGGDFESLSLNQANPTQMEGLIPERTGSFIQIEVDLGQGHAEGVTIGRAQSDVALFARLDLATDVCGALGVDDSMPKRLRDTLLESMRSAS